MRNVGQRLLEDIEFIIFLILYETNRIVYRFPAPCFYDFTAGIKRLTRNLRIKRGLLIFKIRRERGEKPFGNQIIDAALVRS